jgi:hypothetical protein
MPFAMPSSSDERADQVEYTARFKGLVSCEARAKPSNRQTYEEDDKS